MKRIAVLVLGAASAVLAAQDLDRIDPQIEARSRVAAEQRIRAKLALEPGNSELRASLAHNLTQQRKFDAALSEYRTLAQREPNNVDHRYAIGLLQVWRGAPNDAVAEFDQARIMAPAYEEIWQAQINALESLDTVADRERAARLRDEAERKFPGSAWTIAAVPAPANRNVPVVRNEPTITLKSEAGLGNASISGDRSRMTTIGASVDADHLSRGGSNWRGLALQLTHRIDARHLIAVSLRETRRFGLRDSQIEVTYSLPLTTSLTGSVEAGYSPQHQVLPQRSVALGLQYAFAPSWLIHGSVKNISYSNASINQANLMLEHYFSSWRVAAAWRPTRAFGTTVHGGEARFDHYYGDTSSIGIAVSAGKEAATLEGPVVVVSNVRAVYVNGRHWVNRDWAMHYEIGSTRQGDSYTRNGVLVGVQYAF